MSNTAYYPEAFQVTLSYVKEDLENLCQSTKNYFDDFDKVLTSLQLSYCKGKNKAKIRRFLRFLSIKARALKKMVDSIISSLIHVEIGKLETETWLKSHQVIDELNKVLTDLTKASDQYEEKMGKLEREFAIIRKTCSSTSLIHSLICLVYNNLTILHGNTELQFKTISENLHFVVSKMASSRMFYDHFANKLKK